MFSNLLVQVVAFCVASGRSGRSGYAEDVGVGLIYKDFFSHQSKLFIRYSGKTVLSCISELPGQSFCVGLVAIGSCSDCDSFRVFS